MLEEDITGSIYFEALTGYVNTQSMELYFAIQTFMDLARRNTSADFRRLRISY
jgi:hypothetical protein